LKEINIIIIDDEPDAIETIYNIIKLNSSEYKVIASSSNPIEGIELIKRHKPDILFLDIEMPEMSGFKLLESLPKIDFEIIFVTAYEQYALKAIKSGALDYILKPVNISELHTALDKAKSRIEHQTHLSTDYISVIKEIYSKKSKRIRIPTISGFEFIIPENLIRLEADGSYTNTFFTDGKQLMISKTIKDLKSLFSSNMFFRSHRSHIINLYHIVRFERGKNNIIMADNSVIPLSRKRVELFNEALNNLCD